MNLSMIKAGDCIIAPTYLHHEIRKQLLQDRNGFANVKILSLATFFDVQEKDATYAYYITLQAMKDTLHYQKNSIHSLAFINELKTIITHMKQYQIDFTSIPANDEVSKEIKSILCELYPIPLAIDQMQEHFLDKIHQMDSVYIMDTYSDIYENQLYKMMCQNNAKILPFTSTEPKKEWYYALNKRSEIESVAQYIIRHEIDAEAIKITLLDTIYIPYIKMIFNHYQIPFTVVNETKLSFIQNKFIALLNYYLNPTHETSIHILSSQLFSNIYRKQTIDYMNLYELDFHDSFTIMDKVSITNDVVDEREVKRLCQLEEKAKQTQQQILPILLQMEACVDCIDVLCFIDEFLIQNHHFTCTEDTHAILQIREEIKKADKYLRSKEDLSFFITILQNLSIPCTSDIQGCIISDLRHPLPYKTYHFMLGATQDNYPAMKAFEGVFDEHFYESLHYPNLEKRHALHMQYVNAQLKTSEFLIASYPISTFDGKANEASLELEQYFAPLKASKYELNQQYVHYQRSYQISEKSAQQLYLKDNVLLGSVSSLERYANCPYAYFLRYGLRIEEPIDYSFSNAKAGTLQHYLMEHLAQLHGTQYANAKKEEVHNLLAQKVDELIQIYPNKQTQLKQMQIRLLETMIQNLKILRDHDENSSFTYGALEYQIQYDIELDKHRTLHLNGFIDRIDMNKDFFRIIDYKSSPKLLKEENVFAALQLQLMTYLVIIEKQMQLRPLGAFYYSFANPNINMSYAKLKRRPLGYEIYKESDGFTSLLKEKKMSGWITSEYIEVMDASGTHIKGVRNSKTSGISASTIYNPETLATYLIDIYKQLANSILSGHIECKSVSGACTYCAYASICSNANHAYTKEEMIKVDTSLYLKGGRKDA